MSLDIAKGKYAYLFCNNAKKGKCSNKEYVKQEIVLEQAEEILKGIELSDVALKELQKFLDNRRCKGVKDRNVEVLKLRKEYEQKQNEIGGLMAALTTAQSKNSILAVNAIIDSVEKKQKEKEEINYKLKNCSENDNKVNIALASVVKLAKEAYNLFKSSHCKQKRQILNFVSSNFKNPFDKIAKGTLIIEYSGTRIRT